jgi:hypothetical protein
MRMLVVLGLVGCAPIDLSSDATQITATADGNGTDVSICAGPSQLLDCNENQFSFQVTFGSDTEPATEGFLSFGTVDAFFADEDADTPIAVVRTEDNATATASLPAPFTLTGPLSTETIPSGASIQLTWDNSSADSMTRTTGLTCNGTEYFGQPVDIDDTGSLTISTDDFPAGESGACSAGVTITRTRDGDPGDVLKQGSTMVAEQARSVGFMLLR